jgi:hypothetical protein
MGFCSLQHLQGTQVDRFARGCHTAAPIRPQGLVTLSTVSSLRTRAGLVSCRQRSWDSPCGASSTRMVTRAFPRGVARVPFRLTVLPPHEAEGRPMQAAVPGLCSFRASLAMASGISAAAAGCSLGLRPLRVCWTTPGRDFAQLPPARFTKPHPKARLAGVLEYRSALPAPRPADAASCEPLRATLTGFCACCVPKHSNEPLPGL